MIINRATTADGMPAIIIIVVCEFAVVMFTVLLKVHCTADGHSVVFDSLRVFPVVVLITIPPLAVLLMLASAAIAVMKLCLSL